MAVRYIRQTDSLIVSDYLKMYSLDRSVSKELGYPLFNDKSHVWYFALNENDVIGFCAAIKNKNNVSFSHDYVRKDFRGVGVYKNLFDMRLNEFSKHKIKSVCTSMSIKTFLHNGFVIVRQTKNFTFVKLN